MKKFYVTIEEHNVETFEVEAESAEQAWTEVEKAFMDGRRAELDSVDVKSDDLYLVGVVDEESK